MFSLKGRAEEFIGNLLTLGCLGPKVSLIVEPCPWWPGFPKVHGPINIGMVVGKAFGALPREPSIPFSAEEHGKGTSHLPHK